MTRLYAATGDAVAVIENGTVELTLKECGAQCLAVDPKDPDTVYAGTSDEGLFKSSDGGRSWERLLGDCPPQGYVSSGLGGERGRIRRDRTEQPVREPGRRRVLAGVGRIEEPPFGTDLELPA
jgi:hypothetical protein